MRIGKLDIKRRVWIGLACALVVTGMWWTTARERPVVAAAEPAPAPFVRLAGAGQGEGDLVLREQAELMDPTPLFFPTAWNYGQLPLRAEMRRQPGQVFASFPPNVDFGAKGIEAYGSEVAVVPDRLVDVLVQGNEAPFAGMGQIGVQRPALVARSAYVEVKMNNSLDSIVRQSLADVILPRPDFAPMEFLAVVSSAGLVGDLVLVSGSGWEEVDSYFSSYLVKSFRLGERLNPGRYRVVVGP